MKRGLSQLLRRLLQIDNKNSNMMLSLALKNILTLLRQVAQTLSSSLGRKRLMSFFTMSQALSKMHFREQREQTHLSLNLFSFQVLKQLPLMNAETFLCGTSL
jgi:hypothetical protein